MRWHNIEEHVLLLQASGKQSFISSESPTCHFRNSYDMNGYQLRTYVMAENFFHTIDVIYFKTAISLGLAWSETYALNLCLSTIDVTDKVIQLGY